MRTMRIHVVEDDAGQREKLVSYLERYADEHGLSFQITQAADAESLMMGTVVCDLAFLDINLPGKNGMEAARILRTSNQSTQIIFVTDFAQFALRGYEVNALDFIVKPVSYYGLAMRMDKCMRILGRTLSRGIVINTRDGTRVVSAADIVCVEVRAHNLTFHLSMGEELVERGSMAAFIKELDDDRFVRISVSHLVNMSYIESVKGDRITTVTGDEYYFSRGYRKEALVRIARYLGGA